MKCVRCGAETAGKRWCADCDRDFDGWNRQHASDIIVPALGGMLVVITCAMALPLLGVSWIFSLAGVFGGFGTLVGTARLLKGRRRRQFVIAGIPRAQLQAPKPTP